MPESDRVLEVPAVDRMELAERVKQRANRYDAYVHIDRITAIRPLSEELIWHCPVLMGGYPTGY
jgi:hypothetical protein